MIISLSKIMRGLVNIMSIHYINLTINLDILINSE